MRGVSLAALLLLAACSDPAAKDEAAMAAVGEGDGRIACALQGAEQLAELCSISETQDAQGTVLIVGRGDIGYRRLRITRDGRGVVSADGAEAAQVAIIDDRLIEVRVGDDRYRLPASVGDMQ